MQFCPKCGSVIIVKSCAKCDYQADEEVKLETIQEIIPTEGIAVVTEGDNEVHPIVKIICKKCQHNESYFWTRQTRSGDEAETKFFKCTKCKYTWRVYR